MEGPQLLAVSGVVAVVGLVEEYSVIWIWGGVVELAFNCTFFHFRSVIQLIACAR